MKLTAQQIHSFQSAILTYYKKHKRNLPWRKMKNSWQILLSEVMLQQTQVERVVPYFKKFIKQFPTPRALARASLKEVLLGWQGLGYNRRALLLKRAAEILVRDFGGKVPRDAEELNALPGIGAYTAGAILAFAFDQPAVFIETNIRTVFLHFFFKSRRRVPDAAILELVRQTLPPHTNILQNVRMSPRKWYSALLDYGAHLKETVGNLNAQKSANYAKQSSFKGSRRELRAEILRRAVKDGAPLTLTHLRDIRSSFSVGEILSDLVSEGFLQKKGNAFILQR